MKRFLPFIVGMLVIIATFAIYYDTNTIYKYQYDDSLLSYRFAISLSEYGVMKYNQSEKPMMPGSPLYVVVLAAFYKMGFHNLEVVSCVLNMLALGTIAAFVFMAMGGSWFAFALSLVVSLHGFISGWAISGMDTIPLAAVLLVFSYYTFIKEHKTLSLILLILICMMRIEGVLMVVPWLMMNFRLKRHRLVLLLSLTLFYSFNLYYYGGLLPASFYAKKYLAYYHSQPQYLIHLWLTFASAPVIFFLCSMFTRSLWNSNLKYLAVYIVLSGVSCLVGPSDNWARYSIHLLPLMCLFAPFVLKRKSENVVIVMLFALQAYYATAWMHTNATVLAPVQEARRAVGEWMNVNLDKNEWILSTDFACIGYVAHEFQFLDINGLVVEDVLECYKHGENIQSVIDERRPKYLVDTMNLINGKLEYNGLSGRNVQRGVAPLELPGFKPLFYKQAGGTRIICVGELQ